MRADRFGSYHPSNGFAFNNASDGIMRKGTGSSLAPKKRGNDQTALAKGISSIPSLIYLQRRHIDLNEILAVNVELNSLKEIKTSPSLRSTSPAIRSTTEAISESVYPIFSPITIKSIQYIDK